MPVFLFNELCGVGRVRREQATGEQVIAGDINEQADAGQRDTRVRQRLGRGSDAVAEGLGGEIMAGPDGGIAAARIVINLIVTDLTAVGGLEDGIEDRAMRQVALTNVLRDGNGVIL